MRKILLLLCIATSSNAQQPTYYEHIAPVIANACAPCHRPGEAAPFPLLTYEDVSKRASFIKEVTQARYMPPWKADPHYARYANERLLKPEEIRLISEWVNAGMPKGKTTAARATWPTGTQYTRSPDLTLHAKHAYAVKGDNTERFVIFRVPFSMADSMNVEAVEFVSSNKKVLHHVNYAVYEVEEGTDIHLGEDHLNVTGNERSRYDEYTPLRKKMRYYGGWIPGASYESYPQDIGWVMPKRGVILFTVHYAPVGRDEEERCGINLFFRKEKIKRVVSVINIGSGGVGERDIDPYFFIQPDTVKKFTVKVATPNLDQSLLYVWPHMHLLGKEFKAWAITPAGDTVRLVHIPAWDFKWQEIYKFKHPVKIPRGSVLTVEGTYDNTRNNPSNPFNPPRTIYSSGDMKSVDEMLTLVMLFIPYADGDEKILNIPPK